MWVTNFPNTIEVNGVLLFGNRSSGVRFVGDFQALHLPQAPAQGLAPPRHCPAMTFSMH